jgi:hypothetical protein
LSPCCSDADSTLSGMPHIDRRDDHRVDALLHSARASPAQ